MTQSVRSLVVLFSVFTATVASAAGQSANKPANCLAAFRQASFEYYHTGDRDVETMQTAEYVTGGAGLVFGGMAVAKAKATGGVIAAFMVGASAYSYYNSCTRLNRLENAKNILSIYENLRNNGGVVDIPEGQDLLLETFSEEAGARNCNPFSSNAKSEEVKTDMLKGVSELSKQLVMTELVNRMESGELCTAKNSPKELGEIVAGLKDYERAKTRGVF